MTSTAGPASTPVRFVAGFVLTIDTLLLLVAAWMAADTWYELSQPGYHGFTSLGYFFAGLIAFFAVPSLPFAVAAIRARGRVAVVCACLAVAALVIPAVWVALAW